MENNKEYHIERTNFDAFVHAVGSEIEQAQVRLIIAANVQIQSADCQSLEFTQEAPAQIQDVEKTVSAIYRMDIREIEKVFLTSLLPK